MYSIVWISVGSRHAVRGGCAQAACRAYTADEVGVRFGRGRATARSGQPPVEQRCRSSSGPYNRAQVAAPHERRTHTVAIVLGSARARVSGVHELESGRVLHRAPSGRDSRTVPSSSGVPRGSSKVWRRVGGLVEEQWRLVEGQHAPVPQRVTMCLDAGQALGNALWGARSRSGALASSDRWSAMILMCRCGSSI